MIYPAPAPILVLGLVLGSLSGLVAMGLVLVYRANRIVNFAQLDIGAAAAALAASLHRRPGPQLLGRGAVGLAVAVGFGALVEVGIIRRFRNAPRLQLTVATIGLAQLFQVLTLGIPSCSATTRCPSPRSRSTFTLRVVPGRSSAPGTC